MNESTTTAKGPGRRFFIVDEERLRELVLDLSPDIRRDTERVGDLVREMVKLEREKLGLDQPRGTLELWLNKEKKEPGEPDWIGRGRVAGRPYRVAGFVSKNHTLQIALLPLRRS